MSGTSNFMTDTMNAQGLMGLMGPNPYLQYTGKVPMAGFYGAPTDAMGNPIASFTQAQQQHDAWNAANPAPVAPPQGTTLNSTPQHGVGGLQPGQWDASGTGLATGTPTGGFQHATMSDGMPYGQTNLGRGVVTGGGQGSPTMMGQPQQQAAPAAPQNPIDMRQAYLDALSNPGKVTTPGAQMLPGTSPTGPQSQPSVLAQFLQQHPGGGTTGGGGYSNQGFFSTLNALKQGATT